MSNVKKELDQKVLENWRKNLKKMKIQDINPVPRPVKSSNLKLMEDVLGIVKKVEESRVVIDRDIWTIRFPKLAPDLLDEGVFQKNVIHSAQVFDTMHFPFSSVVSPQVTMDILGIHIEYDSYSFFPRVSFQPTIAGKKSDIEKFLEPIRRWSGYELYWKGSFLKSKTTGKIIGMKLSGLAYNIPDKMCLGQPISYQEKILI